MQGAVSGAERILGTETDRVGSSLPLTDVQIDASFPSVDSYVAQVFSHFARGPVGDGEFRGVGGTPDNKRTEEEEYNDNLCLSLGDFVRGTVSRPLDLEIRTKEILVPMFKRVDERNRKCISQADFVKAFGSSRYAAMSMAAGDPASAVLDKSQGEGSKGLANHGAGRNDEGSPAWCQAVLETVADAFDTNLVKISEIFDEYLEDPETELEAGDYENDLLPAGAFRKLLQKWYSAGISDHEDEEEKRNHEKTVISKYGMDSLTGAFDRQNGADGKISRAEFQ